MCNKTLLHTLGAKLYSPKNDPYVVYKCSQRYQRKQERYNKNKNTQHGSSPRVKLINMSENKKKEINENCE